MAFISLSWGFHPWSPVSAQLWDELCWRTTALQLVCVYIRTSVSPWALLIQISSCKLTSWLDLSPALLLWAFPALQIELPALPQTHLITVVLPKCIICVLSDSWLILAIVSRYVLLTSFRYCGWALAGETGPCWPCGPITSWLILL